MFLWLFITNEACLVKAKLGRVLTLELYGDRMTVQEAE